MADRNEVKLTGVAISDPTFTRMGGTKTPMTSFLLQVNEQFMSNGKQVSHPNVIVVECLGQHADPVMYKVKKGMRYEVTGYIRTEQSRFSVRAFVVNKEPNDDIVKYLQGVEVALELLMNSRDKHSAIDGLRQILHEGKL